MTLLEDLGSAVEVYLAAQAELEAAEGHRSAAHRAHVATIPMVGRVRVGKGDDRTRKAHHEACSKVVTAQLQVTRAGVAVVAAAVALTTDPAVSPTGNAPDAAHGVSESNPGRQEASS